MTPWHSMPFDDYRNAVFALLPSAGHLTPASVPSGVLARAHKAADTPENLIAFLARLDNPQALSVDEYYRARVRSLNYLARTAMGLACLVVQTEGINALPAADQSAIREKIEGHKAFDDGNNPYGEEDFDAIEHNGQRVLFKIDYYDKNLAYGSEDPANPYLTTRVLTLMLVHEY